MNIPKPPPIMNNINQLNQSVPTTQIKKSLIPLDDANTWIVVDFSNVAWQSLFASGVKDVKTVMETYDGHMPVFMDKMKQTIREVGQMENSLIFALDSFPQFKLNLDPGYKQNREPIKFNPKKGLLDYFAKEHAFYTAKIVEQEADDVIASIIKTHPDKQIIVVTSDKDLWQLLELPNCNIFDPIKREYVTKEMLSEKFKLERFGHIALHKALWGDRGDNVPNAFPRTQKYALPIINQMTESSLKSFFKRFEEEIPNMSKTKKTRENIRRKFEEAKDRIITNYSIVTLNMELPVKFEEYIL